MIVLKKIIFVFFEFRDLDGGNFFREIVFELVEFRRGGLNRVGICRVYEGVSSSSSGLWLFRERVGEGSCFFVCIGVELVFLYIGYVEDRDMLRTGIR